MPNITRTLFQDNPEFTSKPILKMKSNGLKACGFICKGVHLAIFESVLTLTLKWSITKGAYFWHADVQIKSLTSSKLFSFWITVHHIWLLHPLGLIKANNLNAFWSKNEQIFDHNYHIPAAFIFAMFLVIEPSYCAFLAATVNCIESDICASQHHSLHKNNAVLYSLRNMKCFSDFPK